MHQEAGLNADDPTGLPGSLISSLGKGHAQHVMLYLGWHPTVRRRPDRPGGPVSDPTVTADLLRPGTADAATEEVRFRLGRGLELALEFQVAADILRTGVAPTWNEVG